MRLIVCAWYHRSHLNHSTQQLHIMQGSFASNLANLHEDLASAATAATTATAGSFSSAAQRMASVPRTLSKRLSTRMQATDIANVKFQDIFEQSATEDRQTNPRGAKQASECETSEKKAAETREISHESSNENRAGVDVVIANDAGGDGRQEQQSSICSQPRPGTPTQNTNWTPTSTETAPLQGAGKGGVSRIGLLSPLPRPALSPAKICPLPRPIDASASLRAGTTNCGDMPSIEFLTPLPAGDGF